MQIATWSLSQELTRKHALEYLALGRVIKILLCYCVVCQLLGFFCVYAYLSIGVEGFDAEQEARRATSASEPSAWAALRPAGKLRSGREAMFEAARPGSGVAREQNRFLSSVAPGGRSVYEDGDGGPRQKQQVAQAEHSDDPGTDEAEGERIVEDDASAPSVGRPRGEVHRGGKATRPQKPAPHKYLNPTQATLDTNYTPGTAWHSVFLSVSAFQNNGLEEAINIPFCPRQEKFHTFVLRCPRNISEAP